tara:strand:+ start:1079 stop:1276 length:198 start_codon:yes stop_codon:yes gene_type:complete
VVSNALNFIDIKKMYLNTQKRKIKKNGRTITYHFFLQYLESSTLIEQKEGLKVFLIIKRAIFLPL